MGWQDAPVVGGSAGASWESAPVVKPVTAGAVADAVVGAPWRDYSQRVGSALNAVAADVQGRGPIWQALAPTADLMEANPVTRPYAGVARVGVNAGAAVLDAANAVVGAPIAAFFDQFGRPIEAASGGKVPHQTVGDVLSFAVPVAGELGAARQTGQAARAAGMSVHGYEQMVAARDATAAASQAAARAAAAPQKPPGPYARAVAPFAANVSADAAEQQAGQVLVRRATNPSAVRESVSTGADEIVPGSVPTTFQQTGDLGLGALEREVATKNPDLFAQRRAEQNAARVEALNGVQSGADPMDVARAFRQHLDDLDAQTAAAVQAAEANGAAHVAAVDASTGQALAKATTAAQDAASGLGGDRTPEGYGADLRSNITEAEAATRAQEGKLWQAVDPEGDLTGNVTTTKAKVGEIEQAMVPTEQPIGGEEAAIYEAAKAMPDVAPVSHLVALRSRLSAALREELIRNGQTPVYRRLSMLRGAIQDNLERTIADKVAADDVAVGRGTMAPEEALWAKARSIVDDWKQQRASARSNTGSPDPGNSGVGTPGVPGRGGAALPSAGGPGDAAGNPGVPSAPGDGGAAQAAQPAGRTGLDPVARLRGDELAPPDAPITELRQKAAAFFQRVLRGKPVFSSGLNAEVNFGSPGKAIHDSPNPDKLRVFPGLRQLVRDGERIGSEPDRQGRGNIRAWHYLRGPVEVDGRRLDVTVSVREDNSGHLYYNHVVDVGGQAAPGAEAPGMRPGDSAVRHSEGGVGTPEAKASGPNIAPAPADPNQPTFDAEARARLAQATEATKARAARFGLDPVKAVLAKAGDKTQFRLPDGQVPGRFFHPGPAGFEHVKAALKASPDALPVIQDFAAMSLKRDALRPDGTLDPAKFDRWRARHQDALRALPADTQARFETAAKATQALIDATAARTEAIKNAEAQAAAEVTKAVAARKLATTTAERSVAGRLANRSEPADVTRAVGTILNGGTAVADMKALAAQAKDNPRALAGLRQAVADHIASKLIGNTEVGASGLTGIKADAFQTFMRQKRAALTPLFTPAELDTWARIASDIQRAKRSESAVKLPGGSNSPQDIHALAKNAAGKGLRSFLNAFFGALGMMHGPMAAIGTYIGADMVQGFRMAGIERVDQLVTRAMLDPEFARQLLVKVPSDVPLPKVAAVRGRALLRALAIAGATSSANNDQRGPGR